MPVSTCHNTHKFGRRRPIALTASGLFLLSAISNFQFYFENTLQASKGGAYRMKGEEEDGEEEVDEIKKGKVKLPVSLIKHHAMNVYGGPEE